MSLRVGSIPARRAVTLSSLCLSGLLARGGPLTAAGPRPGQIRVLEVTAHGRSDVARLGDAGFNVARANARAAVVYATDAEQEALTGMGFVFRELGRQPSAPGQTGADRKGSAAYHTYAGLVTQLVAFAETYAPICRLWCIGRSVEGRGLWAVQITRNPDEEEDEPEVRYAAAMHGDERLGAELCLRLIEHLLTRYPLDARVSNLVDRTDLWILPVMNPDGFERGARFNTDGHDLNRSFPEGAYANMGNRFHGPPAVLEGRPREVADVMRWSLSRSFTLAANFHTGATVVNYPYDNDARGDVDSPTPDDALFRHISAAYADRNPLMRLSAQFAGGTVNGAAWYVITGGMQDWHYRYLGCNEVTIELADVTAPPATEIDRYWDYNRDSMLAYVETVHMGIRGVVTDARSGRPVFAAVKVHGLDHLTFTDPDAGDYHRMLLPGVYGVTFSAVGYGSHTEYGVSVATGQATRVNVSLDSEGYENRVTVPVSFPNQWVVAAVWDSSASDWSRVETLFAPERVQVPCPAANVWRWLGLWRPGGGSLAAGYWFVRSEP